MSDQLDKTLVESNTLEESQIEIITNPSPEPALLSQDDLSVKRIIAEAMKHGGLREVFVEADNKKHTYMDYMSMMVWDGIIEGEVLFADGTKLSIKDNAKIWVDLVKFLAAHLDGAVTPASNMNQVNIFKIYKGIDPDRI